MDPGLIQHAEIERLVPQKGAMCLLDSVIAFTPDSIACRAVSHLDPANPLIAAGRLGIVCGCEYGMPNGSMTFFSVRLRGPPRPSW